jgi:hypothetical protein
MGQRWHRTRRRNIFFYGKGNENHELGSFVHKRPNEIDHILIDTRRKASVLDVRSFRGADCYADPYLAVANVRERLAVSKQITYKFHMDGFNLKKLNEIGCKEQHRVVK